MAAKIRITIEHIEHLTDDEKMTVRALSTGESLDDFYGFMLIAFKSWFVYKGGNHVALHKTFGDDRRILIASAI